MTNYHTNFPSNLNDERATNRLSNWTQRTSPSCALYLHIPVNVTGLVVDQNSNNYVDVIMGAIPSQITSLAIVYSTVYSDADQRKHQSSAWLAFVRGIHRGPLNSPHKWPETRKMFPFDDVIMTCPRSGLVYGDVCSSSGVPDLVYSVIYNIIFIRN